MKGSKLSPREIRQKVSVDSAYRKVIWKKFLNHVKAGKSPDCFSELSFISIKELMKSHSEECTQEEFDQAMREGKDNWETIGCNQALGTCLGNSRTWYYNMSNRYGWSDRVESKIDANHSGQVTIVSYSKKPS